MLLVWSFWLALFLVLSAANLSTLVSDDISKAHTVAQHLKWVHKLQFLRSVESAWTFSHDINVHEAYQEFSPSCHLAEEVEFSLQLAICLFYLVLKALNRFRNSWFFQDFCNTVRHIPECNLDWYHNHKRYVLQDLNVSAHHCVTAWTSWYQQPFFWNWNANAQGWLSDRLRCQRRIISRSVSSPRSVTGQVFATFRALDIISTSASPSECFTLIPEADNWVPNSSRNACLLYLCIRKSPFLQSMNYGGKVQFFFLAFFYFVPL